jgi:chromosome partitioning protein
MALTIDGIEYLTPEECARYLGLHKETVLRWIRSGRLAATGLPGTKRRYIALSTLKAAVQGQVVEDTMEENYGTAPESYGIYAFINLKGGVGKTTSALFLATVAHELGYPVVVVDADTEQSALRWAESASGAGDALPFAVVAGELNRLAQQAKQLSQGQMVFIDVGPNRRELVMAAGGAADVALVPIAPTGMDADRMVSTLQVFGELEAIVGRAINSHILVTRTRSNETLSRTIDKQLEGLPVLKARIRELTCYKDAFGRVPSQLDEYQAVWGELHA